MPQKTTNSAICRSNSRVDPVAGGTAPDDRGAVAEGVPDKGGEGELVVGQRMAGVPQGQSVVGGQDEVVEDREHHGVEDSAVAHLPELADDVAVVITPQLMMNETDGHDEQTNADNRTDSLEELTLHDLHSPGFTPMLHTTRPILFLLSAECSLFLRRRTGPCARGNGGRGTSQA
jgi:hypothetical protein